MTLKELYQQIDGDYDQAVKVLRMEKLINKHICKLPKNGTVDALIAAGDTMDPTQLFETSHAVKGVGANLGLTALSAAASEISEEFRPGTGRDMTDDEVKAKLAAIKEMYAKTTEAIRRYEAG